MGYARNPVSIAAVIGLGLAGYALTGGRGFSQDAPKGESEKSPTADQVKAWVDAYKKAHPGHGGKDWDILSCCKGASRTTAEILKDPDAVRLRSICGKGQLPVIPLLAWEYGGHDHPWKNPEASALVYCVYIPAKEPSPNWRYDAAKGNVTADVYVKFPEQNPGKDEKGADQVMKHLGHKSNIEILVDTASLHDGADAGLELSEASTDLNLIQPDGTKVHLYTGK